MAWDPGRKEALLFGGKTRKVALDDTWVLRTEPIPAPRTTALAGHAWRELRPKGDAPAPREGHERGEDELIAFCREHLAHCKCPTSVEFVAELPRTATGKLQKFRLREQYWKGRKVG